MKRSLGWAVKRRQVKTDRRGEKGSLGLQAFVPTGTLAMGRTESHLTGSTGGGASFQWKDSI